MTLRRNWIVAAGLLLTPAALAWNEETLLYSINWPSGLSLGEAQISSKPAAGGFEYQMTMEAALPGVPVRGEFRSRVNADGCSLEFHRENTLGARKTSEKSTFDLEAGKLVRETSGGGKSEVATGPCARDALAFIFFLRKELQQGRLPASQTVYYGAAYQLKLQYGGLHQVVTQDTRVEADRLTAMIKGPQAEISFEVFFARDPVRTLVQVKLPLSVGTISMDLLR
ncbi:MAG: DUF3108 domain-containing protein [Acidimicrobiia bacterium]|nr:DUF3108 domain-containing protein [Acidimicrobiia bacterium]